MPTLVGLTALLYCVRRPNLLRVDWVFCACRWAKIRWFVCRGMHTLRIYSAWYCKALSTKSAFPQSIALGRQMWSGRGMSFALPLRPYGIGSTDGYPSSPHSSARRPNPGGKLSDCTKSSRFLVKTWWSSGRFSKGDECFGTATGSWLMPLS